MCVHAVDQLAGIHEPSVQASVATNRRLMLAKCQSGARFFMTSPYQLFLVGCKGNIVEKMSMKHVPTGPVFEVPYSTRAISVRVCVCVCVCV